MSEQRKQTISLCMIVKDEEKTLPACLDSVKSFIDEMIIVDTGSKDQTVNIARHYGAKVFHIPWEHDFAKARNVSLEHATGDWILHLDADERLEPEDTKLLLSLLASDTAEAYFLQIINHLYESSGDKMVFPSIRLWRNRPEYRFTGALHEQISSSIMKRNPAKPMQLTQVRIHHYGYSQQIVQEKNKTERNLKIALDEVKRHPGAPFARYNLAMEYARLNKNSEAIQQFQQALDHLKQPKELWVPNLYKNYANTLVKMRKFHEAIQLADEGIRHFPDYIDLVYLKAGCHFNLGQIPQAVGLFHQCLVMPINPRYPSQVGLNGFKTHNYLGYCYKKLNRPDEAIYHFRLAYLGNTQLKDSLNHLFGLIYRKESMEQAEKQLVELLRPAKAGDYIELAKILLTYYQFARARHYLLQAEELEPANQQVFFLFGVSSMREGNYPQAVYWFEKISSTFSEYTASRLYLYYCYVTLEDEDSARKLLPVIRQNEAMARTLVKLYLEEAFHLLQEGLYYNQASSLIHSAHISQIREAMSRV
ncbi:MAG: glycosyltransferase [Ectobacillus sp.]